MGSVITHDDVFFYRAVFNGSSKVIAVACKCIGGEIAAQKTRFEYSGTAFYGYVVIEKNLEIFFEEEKQRKSSELSF